MIRIRDIKVRENVDEEKLIEIVCKKIEIQKDNIVSSRIIKKSVDARDKGDILFVYTVDLELNISEDIKGTEKVEDIEEEKIVINRKSSITPIIIGAGPAGLFTAITLVENGVNVIVVEQGKTVDERKEDVEKFFNEGKLNVNSNVQFGEGGAGTFSDGKLTTGVNSVYCKKVLETFVRFGAPKEILYINKPHIGTDNLITVIKNMREYIISKGGQFIFNEKVVDFKIEQGNIAGITCSKELNTDTLILATGHSSRDTFIKLHEKGINMEIKPFSVGVRIEHSQKMINKSQYGDKNTKLKLPQAEYKLVYHDKDGRSAYTFCMCPGGEVIAGASEQQTVVTNGMSKYLRDGENANSAILVNVNKEDLSGDSPLAGIYFQRELENKAYVLAGSNYNAPIQTVGDFLEDKRSSKTGTISPTYKPGTTFCMLNEILPDYVVSTIKKAIIHFDKKIKGFANKDAILTGVETRSSSPIRINRNEYFMSNINGIYPCGEGAGYAGGIMSSAIDGIKVAKAILENE